jgi:branched-chain amino acid aminotransferase
MYPGSPSPAVSIPWPAKSYFWQDGALHEASSTTLSPLDHGFTVGNGTFETLLAVNGSAFALTRHWRRLCIGCTAMQIKPPKLEMMRAALQQVLQANQIQSARLRFTVTSGVGLAGATTKSDQVPTCVASASPYTPPSANESLVVLPWCRNENGALTGIKSTSYAENVRALHYARSCGAGEAVFLNTQHELCEGAASNLFVVIEGQIYTPPLSSGCLAGVTRELVMEQARKVGISILENRLIRDDLYRADEVFITSTLRGVQPVTNVDNVPFSAAPGPSTLKIRQLYAELQGSYSDP